MATALDTCLAEIAAMRRFHDAKGADLVDLGHDCRRRILLGESEAAVKSRHLAGRILMYRDMAHQALKAARAYKDGIGKVPRPVIDDVRYYRRCAANLMRELRAQAPAVSHSIAAE